MRGRALPDGGVATVAREEERLGLDHVSQAHPGTVTGRKHRVSERVLSGILQPRYLMNYHLGILIGDI